MAAGTEIEMTEEGIEIGMETETGIEIEIGMTERGEIGREGGIMMKIEIGIGVMTEGEIGTMEVIEIEVGEIEEVIVVTGEIEIGREVTKGETEIGEMKEEEMTETIAKMIEAEAIEIEDRIRTEEIGDKLGTLAIACR